MLDIIIGILTASDRASAGIYEDISGPAIVDTLNDYLGSEWHAVRRVVSDDRPVVEKALIELADEEGCCLIVTTGGTGPAPRDVTPEATLAVADRVMPGFGEQMRQISLHFVPTAILSRQVAVIRGQALIINLPGQPKAIAETLAGHTNASGIFAAVPYCIDLIGGPYLETRDEVCKAFRPKSAQRPPAY